jgi:hypothetical protein
LVASLIWLGIPDKQSGCFILFEEILVGTRTFENGMLAAGCINHPPQVDGGSPGSGIEVALRESHYPISFL